MLSQFHGPERVRVSRLHVETLTSERELGALEAAWVALERSAANQLPFRSAAWTLAWWQQVRERSRAVHDALRIRVLRDDDGVVVGIAPLMLTERPAVGPLRTRCLQFIGADPNWTEVRGLLCHPSREPECYAALQADVGRRAQEWDWIAWSGVPDAVAAAAEAPHLRSTGLVSCFAVDLPPTWEALRDGLSRNIKEAIRKCYNSLRRDGMRFTFEVATRREEMRPALDDFFRLHARRAALTGTVRHLDHFQDARGAAFLVEACERLADRGEAYVFRLRIGGQVVATRIGLAATDTLYFYYSGYDPAFARYSVMTTALVEAIKYAIGAGYRVANLGSGNDPSKTRWSPRRVDYHHGVQVSPELRGRVAHRAFVLARDALQSRAVSRYARPLLARRPHAAEPAGARSAGGGPPSP